MAQRTLVVCCLGAWRAAGAGASAAHTRHGAAALAAQGIKIDMVDCFRKSEDIPPLAAEAVAVGAQCLWLQLGVFNEAAVARAESAGLLTVQNRCVKIEHARIFGGLGWMGVNTKVISSKRLQQLPY